jgi:hypothetical protein
MHGKVRDTTEVRINVIKLLLVSLWVRVRAFEM